MKMHEKKPNVVHNALHLPRMYKVVFNANDDVALFLQIVEHERTKLIHILQDVLYTNAR
jgi:hypothetical protein